MNLYFHADVLLGISLSNGEEVKGGRFIAEVFLRNDAAFKDFYQGKRLFRGIRQNRVQEVREAAIDHKLSALAANIAVRRHAGRLEPRHSKVCGLIQRGKNLEDIQLVIGTGGPVINSKNPAGILREVLKTDHDKKFNLLLPEHINRCAIDGDYVLYAAGILKDYDPDAALAIMKNSLRDVI